MPLHSAPATFQGMDHLPKSSLFMHAWAAHFIYACMSCTLKVDDIKRSHRLAGRALNPCKHHTSLPHRSTEVNLVSRFWKGNHLQDEKSTWMVAATGAHHSCRRAASSAVTPTQTVSWLDHGKADLKGRMLIALAHMNSSACAFAVTALHAVHAQRPVRHAVLIVIAPAMACMACAAGWLCVVCTACEW